MSWLPLPPPARRLGGVLMLAAVAVGPVAGCSAGRSGPPTSGASTSTSSATGIGTATAAGSGPATGTGSGPATGASLSPTLSPPATPGDPAIRAVLSAVDGMNSHGPYRITLTADGTTAFLDVVPPGSVRYHAAQGDTVGDEIAVDGSAWSRGPDGRWHPADDVTHHGPQLTVTDVTAVTEDAPGHDGTGAYRTFRVDGHDASGAYRAQVTLWTADGRLRDVRMTGADQLTTTYAFTYPSTLKITAPPSP